MIWRSWVWIHFCIFFSWEVRTTRSYSSSVRRLITKNWEDKEKRKMSMSWIPWDYNRLGIFTAQQNVNNWENDYWFYIILKSRFSWKRSLLNIDLFCALLHVFIFAVGCHITSRDTDAWKTWLLTLYKRRKGKEEEKRPSPNKARTQYLLIVRISQ